MNLEELVKGHLRSDGKIRYGGKYVVPVSDLMVRLVGRSLRRTESSKNSINFNIWLSSSMDELDKLSVTSRILEEL
jgi:hypothetical protein